VNNCFVYESSHIKTQKRPPKLANADGRLAISVVTDSLAILSRNRVHTYPLAGFVNTFKFDHSIYQGKQGVILPYSHILSSVEFGSHLSYENMSRLNKLSSKTLNASSFTGAITTLSRTSSCFFMSHFLVLASQTAQFSTV
jgi:hypothetical protein